VLKLGPSSFVCTLCGKQFSRKLHARYHVRLHYGHQPHVCTICNKSFVDPRNLCRHKKRHVPVSKRPHCEHCGARFLTERCLRRHSDGSFHARRCTLCGAQHHKCPAANYLHSSQDSPVIAPCRRGRPPSKLVQTNNSNSGAQHSTCPTADNSVNRQFPQDSSNLSVTAPCRRGRPPSKFRHYDLTWARVRSNSSATLTKRMSSPTVALHPSSSTNHFSESYDVNKNHRTTTMLKFDVSGSFGCPECGKQLASKRNLIRHFRQHTGERPYSCVDCGRTFVDQSNMKKHCRSHHGVDRSAVLTDSVVNSVVFLANGCSDLSVPFQSGSGGEVSDMGASSELVRMIKTELMSDHLDVETSLPPKIHRAGTFVCFMCNRSFMYKSSLESHIVTHVDDRPYQCEICGKGYKRACDLLIHARFHDDQKRYECQECGRRFRWKNGLVRHTQSHTGMKPYLCNQCGRAFADWDSQKKHMRLHAGLPRCSPMERCACKLCGKTFAWKRGLERHTKQAHYHDVVPLTVVRV